LFLLTLTILAAVALWVEHKQHTHVVPGDTVLAVSPVGGWLCLSRYRYCASPY
jgi:hypothetical protein